MLLPVLREKGGGAPVGQFLTAYALACGAVPFIATFRGRTPNVRVLSLVALAALAAAALAFANGAAFPVRLGARAVAGAASGILSMTLLLAAARIGDDRNRARGFAVITAGQLSALVVGIPVVVQFRHAVPQFFERNVYVAIGVVGTLLAVWLAVTAVEVAPPESVRPMTIRRAVRERGPALILLATGLVGAVMAGPVGYLTSYLTGMRGFTIEASSAVYLWSGIGPLLAMPVSGRLVGRWSPSQIAIAGSILIALPIALFPHVAVSFPTAAALMLACVFIETLRRAALQGTLADAVNKQDLPRFLALRGVTLQFGLAAGYAVAEPFFHLGGFGLVCIIAAGVSLTAAAVLWAATRPTGSACR